MAESAEAAAAAAPAAPAVPLFEEQEEALYQKRLRIVKTKVRSDLEDPEEWWEQGYNKWTSDRIKTPESVDRIHHTGYSPERFREEYEIPYKPCLIQCLVDTWNSKCLIDPCRMTTVAFYDAHGVSP